MKTLSQDRHYLRKGLTLIETLVAVTMFALLGGICFQVLNSGLILYAKNTAVNTAHEEARQGITRLTRDIHTSVSVPQLRAVDFTVVSSTPVGGVAPTSAGVSFQNIASGPNFVWKDPNNSSLIMIKNGYPKPRAGMRLIVPYWGLEEDITKAQDASPNHSNVFIYADQSTPQIDAPVYETTYAITYYTYRTMYLVQNGSYVADSKGDYILSGGNYVSARTYTASPTGAWILSQGVYVPYSSGSMQRYTYTNSAAQRYRYENGELHLYQQEYNGTSVYWKDTATVAKYISSPQPFYVPLNSAGSPDTKYVGVRLTARDPKSSNRGYLATASLLDTQVDYRSKICLQQ